ncbi:MAG: Ppx/GppA family phosphatase [Aerococcus sp.]|nr:Ppx/GppA family phosphatase [Aerococcus sp.]
MKERIGLIDIGSNSIRLVIFQVFDNFTIKEIQNIKVPSRIFQYLDDKSNMSEEGITVLCDVLSGLTKEAELFRVDRIIAKGTAALRQSVNRDDIVTIVKEKVGLTIDIIPGRQEAYYGVTAVFHSIALTDGITLDIGGGSSEVTLFKDKQIVESYSFPFGAVTLKNKFFADVPHNDKDAIEETRKFIKAAFAEHPFMKDAQLPLIGIGGAARNIVRVYQSMIDYPLAGLHNFEMQRKDFASVLERFKDASPKEMKNIDGLSSDRADIIVPALLVYIELLDTINAPFFRFSQRGLREGIIYDYVQHKYPDAYDINNIARQTIERLPISYHFDIGQAAQRMVLARKLYQALHDEGFLTLKKSEEKLMAYGAFCYHIGRMVEANSASQHTFYLLANTNLEGFTHHDRVVLSLIASFKNRSLFKTYLSLFDDWFSDKEIKLIQTIGGMVKFANCLNISNQVVIQTIDFVHQKDTLILRIFYKGKLLSEVSQCENQKKHIERIVGEDIHLEFINQKDYTRI